MKKSIILFIKGFIMGIANIIPGVSGGTLALILGFYEQFIKAISHFFSDFKNNLKFLIPLGLGILISIASMSNVIDFSYNHFPLATTLFFVGLVVGGIPLLVKNVKGKKDSKKSLNIIFFILTFSLVIFMALSDTIFGGVSEVNLNNLTIGGYILLFLVGVVAAATMVVPGVSGSLVLMLLGYYYPIIALIKNILKMNNLVTNLTSAFIFGIGVLIGIILVSKLFEYLFKKHKTITYYGVLGFIFASLFAIPYATFSSVSVSFKLLEVLCGIVIFGIGVITAYILGDK